MTSQTEPLTVTTTDGVHLEAEIGRAEAPTLAAVITHPHPLHGGNMYAPVNAELFRRANQLDLATLRFNFRGVGQSTGIHGNGVDEAEDIAAAIRAVRDIAGPDVPVVLGGWSFGADTALAVADPAVAGWFAVAPPLGVVDVATMVGEDPRPKMLMVPEHDQFAPPAVVTERTAGWQNTQAIVVRDADHFLAGHNRQLADAFEMFCQQLLA